MLMAVLALTPPSLSAAADDGPTRPFENGLFFELFGSHERDYNRDNGRKAGWEDTFFSQKLTYLSRGYIYHPRFLRYRFSVGAGLEEERYTPTFAPSVSWTRDTAFEYEARLLFLPEHSYNFEMFALRREPLYKEQAAVRHQAVETSYGASFRYRKRPWFTHVNFIDNTTESGARSSNVRRLNLDGEYFKEFANRIVFSTTAFFTPSRFSNNQGLTGSGTDYGLSALVNSPNVRLSTSASKGLFDQESPFFGRLENDQFIFQERIDATLPLHFRMDFGYRVLNAENRVTDPGAAVPRRLTDDSREFQATVSHRLYQSLDSRYLFLRNSRSSTGGDSTVVSHTLGFDYAKRIPHGRVLIGLNGSTLRTDNAGRADIANEPHASIAVPGTFALTQTNVDAGTLAVYLRSPVTPFEAVPLVENVHYTVTQVANSLQVTVFLLPPAFVVPGTYDFFVSYSLTIGSFEMRTNSYGASASVQLLDDMLTPYYRYVTVSSTLLAGTFPGLAPDSTTHTAGLTFADGGWRANGEFQSVSWDASPYKSVSGELQYSGSFDPFLRLYGTAGYLHRHYPHGFSASAPTPYTEENLTFSGSLEKEFPAKDLTVSAGASYNRGLGLVDSNAYALNSAVTWRMGKLELSAGVDIYGSDARSANVGGRYNRTHQYYYIKIRRRIL